MRPPLDGIASRQGGIFTRHVTRLGPGNSSRVESGVRHHVADLDTSMVLTIRGLPTTNPVRTVVDLSRQFGYTTGLVAADAALHRGASQEERGPMPTRSSRIRSAP